MRKKGYLASAIAVTAAMIAVNAARADIPVEIAYVGVDPGVEVNIDSGTPDRVVEPAEAGSFNHFVNDPSGLIITGEPTEMFCLDLMQAPEPITEPPATPAYPGDFTTYQLVRPREAPQPDDQGWANYPMGPTREAWLRVMAKGYWEAAWLTPGDQDSSGDIEWYEAADYRYAALQVAIWEVVYEDNTGSDPWDALEGDFLLFVDDSSGSVLNDTSYRVGMLANGILDDVWDVNGPAPDEEYWLGALVHDTYQDMLVRTFRDVPEPSGMALAALGILGLVSRRRKRS